MVPLDGSDLAEAALPLARELAMAVGARVMLVRVEPFIGLRTGAYAVPAADVAYMEAAAATAAEAYLQEVRGQLSEEVRTDTLLVRGAPAPELVAFAQREHADLVVMATHGRGGLRRLVLGSTADRMVRSGVPTLLVRPSGAVAAGVAATTTDRPAPPATSGTEG
jgi:nucleotide-binding universal stress UspA family protein